MYPFTFGHNKLNGLNPPYGHADGRAGKAASHDAGGSSQGPDEPGAGPGRKDLKGRHGRPGRNRVFADALPPDYYVG